MSQRLREYWQLLRLHRPTGLWLALWPALWALWLAAAGVPPYGTLAVFVAGALLLRTAACVADDILDHLFHPGAERSKDRPLAGKRLSLRQALWPLALLCALLLYLASQLDPYVLTFAVPIPPLLAIHYFAHRMPRMAQVYSGMASACGIPMAYAAVRHSVPWIEAALLIAASLLWAASYVAFYAMSSRRYRVPEPSGAPGSLLGRHLRALIVLMQVTALAALAQAGVETWRGPGYYVGLLVAAAFAARQLWTIRRPGRDASFTAFLYSNGFGAAVFGGMAWDFAFEAYAATKSAALASLGAAGLLTANGCFDPLPERMQNHDTANYGYCVARNITFTPAEWPQPLQLDAYTPQRQGPAPVVLLIYGGGWNFGVRHTMELPAVLLARRGYVVLNLSHRFAPAYHFPAQLQDLQQAVHWTYRHAGELGADPQRIGAWGFSSGAHLAAMLALIDPHDPWGAPDIRLRALVGDGTPSDLSLFHDTDVPALLGATQQQNPDLYRHASPLYQVSPRAPPTFLYAGENDTGVPLEQSLLLRDALRKAGVQVQLQVLPGAGHTRMTYPDVAAAMTFLDVALKP